MNWNLDDLYTSFDSKEFQEDLVAYKESVKELSEWVNKNLTNDDGDPVQKIEKYIHFYIDSENYRKLSSFAHLTLSTEAENITALKYQGQIQEIGTELSGPSVVFRNFVMKFDKDTFDGMVNSSKLLKEHEFYLNEIREKGMYMLSEKEEVLISKMKITGSNAWNTLKEQLFGTLMAEVEIDGEIKQLPISTVRNYAHDNDPELRKKGYESELKAYKQIDKAVAFCLNSIKGEVLTISKMRKYDSPLHMTLVNSNMDKETLDAMLSAIEDSLPKFREYFKKKATLLGHANGLPFYDVFAPMGKSNMTFTYEEAANFVIKNFSDFSEKLGSFAKKAIDSHWIDVEPRKGKRGGAFCSNLHMIKQSRVMVNFTGSLKHVTTLAHELGHGYHGENLKDEYVLNSSYPMPIAETASTFCETLVTNAAMKTASPEERFTLLESSICEAGQVVVDIYSRFLFESELFKKRESGALSVEELNALMMDAQLKAYGDGLDKDWLHPYMWLNKPHYYYAERNFYNFPYAYGLLFSKGLYNLYLKDNAGFVSKYDEMLSITGKNNLRDIALVMGIDVREKSFWESSLRVVADEIDEFLKA